MSVTTCPPQNVRRSRNCRTWWKKPRLVRISRADKDGAVVLQGVPYHAEGGRRLPSNPAQYTAVPKDPTPNIQIHIQITLLSQF